MTTVAELRRGTDSSGRALLSTIRFWKAWQAVLRDPRVAPFAHLIVPVQGAFMALLGGGATASAGYHDRAGCWDVRTWNLSDAQEQILWDVAEEYGIHFWKRDLNPAHGGMDEHGHAVTLWDSPLDSGAASQVVATRNRRDGLARNGPDYMRRKTAPVFTYPAKLIERGDDMTDAKTQAQLDRIEKLAKDTNKDLDKFRTAEGIRDKAEAKKNSQRYRALVTKLGGLADELEGDARAKLLRVLADEPDVTGPDNPAPTKL